MMPWLPLGFAQPLVLLGLLSLPMLWWLLRLIPPQPTRIDFPPARLAEIDSRWVETMLDTLPPDVPFDEPRPAERRL